MWRWVDAQKGHVKRFFADLVRHQSRPVPICKTIMGFLLILVIIQIKLHCQCTFLQSIPSNGFLIYFPSRFTFSSSRSRADLRFWSARQVRHPLQQPGLGLRQVWGAAGQDGEELSGSGRREEAQVCGFPLHRQRKVREARVEQVACFGCRLLSSQEARLTQLFFTYSSSLSHGYCYEDMSSSLPEYPSSPVTFGSSSSRKKPNVCVFFLFACVCLCQERLPKANGGPADSQGHLQLLCGHHVVLHQNRLLCAVWQREHRHLRAGDGQAGDELRVWVVRLLPPKLFPFLLFYFIFIFIFSLQGAEDGVRQGLGEFDEKKIVSKGRELVFCITLAPFPTLFLFF